MKKPDYVIELPVLRRRTIPMEAYGVSAADAARFADLFCHTWATMEHSARRFLLRIWRGRRQYFRDYPKVVLASRQRFVSQFYKGAKKSIYGQCRADSGFYFSDALLNELDGYVEAVIVHELFHDILASLGKTFREMEKNQLENEVNELVSKLGYEFVKKL